MAKPETKYNKIVNIDDENKEIIFLDYTFIHSADAKGATGTTYQLVTEEQIQDNIGELEGDDTELLVYMAENLGELSAEMIRGVDSGRDALIRLFYDDSIHSEPLHEQQIRELYSEDDYPVINCIGGGRCFDKDFQGNTNTELSKIIREFESK